MSREGTDHAGAFALSGVRIVLGTTFIRRLHQ